MQHTNQCCVHVLQIRPGHSCCDEDSSEQCRPQRCRQNWHLRSPKRLTWRAAPRFIAMHFKVSAVLPVDARTFLVERDSAAFRALVARTQKLGALEIEDGWRDGDVQVFFGAWGSCACRSTACRSLCFKSSISALQMGMLWCMHCLTGAVHAM